MPAGRIYEDGANEILKAFFDIGSAPATLEVGLLIGMPAEDADATSLTGLEPVGNGYARLSVPTGSGDWGLVGDGVVGNLNTLTFATATGDWGVITHWFVKIGGSPPFWWWLPPWLTPGESGPEWPPSCLPERWPSACPPSTTP